MTEHTTARVQGLLEMIGRAQTWTAERERDRVVLRVVLPDGGRQVSFLTLAEHAQLERLRASGPERLEHGVLGSLAYDARAHAYRGRIGTGGADAEIVVDLEETEAEE